MHIKDSVSWEQDVFSAWRRAAHNAVRPNSDVWGKLSKDTCWFRGNIEQSDVECLYVIGSGDWKEVFGSYRIVDIVADKLPVNDKYNHCQRFREMQDAIAEGKKFEPLIVVSYSGMGPFVIIDGNHRAVAYLRLGSLVSRSVFIGLHSNIKSDFVWFRQALLT